jgi:hypothetical protein
MQAPTTMVSTQSSSLPPSTSQSIIETELMTSTQTSTSPTPSSVTNSFSTTQTSTSTSTGFLSAGEGKEEFTDI